MFAARLQTVVSMFEAFGKISSSTKKTTGSQCLHPSVGEIVFGARIDRLRSAVVQLHSKYMWCLSPSIATGRYSTGKELNFEFSVGSNRVRSQ